MGSINSSTRRNNNRMSGSLDLSTTRQENLSSVEREDHATASGAGAVASGHEQQPRGAEGRDDVVDSDNEQHDLSTILAYLIRR